jgi:phosphate transport system protein
MIGREHTDKEYEHELRQLREQLLVMGSHVEAIIGDSIKALMERDSALAKRTVAADESVDRMEVELDGLCLQILARRQPVASDLRFITLVLKVVTDLERIADLGVNICERVVELSAEPQLKPYVDLPHMGREVQAMLQEVLDAFVAKDAGRARAIIDRDEAVDALYAQVFRELLTFMMEDAHNVYRATRLQSIAKYLERMADHTTNLAEMVIFMVEGQDVRHMTSREEANGLPRHRDHN